MDNIRIRCPKCEWQPDHQARWQCTCKHIWNTFETGGRCPKCGIVWEDTQCLRSRGGCAQWSPHLDWYDGLDDIVNKLKEEIEHSWAEPMIVTH